MFQAMLGQAGWQPDIPDPRDFLPRHTRVAEMLHDLPTLEDRPQLVDWRHFCPPVEQRDGLPSSTHACVDLVMHNERRVLGERLALSKPFVYQTALRMAQTHAVHQHSLRNVWKTLVRFGAPAPQVWPGDFSSGHEGPDAFAYFSSRDYSSLTYIRLDPREQSGNETLEVVRSFLAAGFCSVVGFPICSAISDNGDIGFPTIYDVIRGGHAALCVGYDDRRRVRSDRGCLLIRSCWGREWGDNGYGWLPYRYVRERLTADFWTVVQPNWLASGEFKFPG